MNKNLIQVLYFYSVGAEEQQTVFPSVLNYNFDIINSTTKSDLQAQTLNYNFQLVEEGKIIERILKILW